MFYRPCFSFNMIYISKGINISNDKMESEEVTKEEVLEEEAFDADELEDTFEGLDSMSD